MIELDRIYIKNLVSAALSEDIGSGDITTLLTVSENNTSTAVMTLKTDGVIAGIEVAKAAFKLIDPDVSVETYCSDGMKMENLSDILKITGKTRAILTAERVALNFMQRMSGIATLTAKYVQLVSHTKARIVDTRKTTPGLRRIEKYSVIVGGGRNHRFGLSDGILIKDNHIAAAGGVRNAVKLAKDNAPHCMKVEVEVTNLKQLNDAIEAKADAVLLDNMTNKQMAEAVKIVAGRLLTEASGGVNENTVKSIAETGVDIISVGALTHSVKALDISLNIV